MELEVEAEGREWMEAGWSKNSKPKPKPIATAEFFPHSGRKVHHRRMEICLWRASPLLSTAAITAACGS